MLCHNHPSGKPNPSRDHDKLTEKIRKACEIMRIYLMDHLIISENGDYSYRERGRI
jgi:DNA repair protein RadC